ncbi:MAG: aldehyde dehydrogenase family protein, partial [archaeon]
MADKLFPTEAEVPEQYRMTPIEQNTYLVNGQLKEWKGARQEVYSPICLTNPDGSISQKRIGSYPLLGEAESKDALAAAVKAYDRGRCVWPTMSVGDRIACVENFTSKMVSVREPVVNSLMWEIGKNRADAEKEFDRTVVYIRDTISALKELDRESSIPRMEEGVFGQVRRSPLGAGLCMGPFNYPLNETYTTLIPAVIMGNSLVFKPAKYGVLLHQPLMEAYAKSFPEGVVNVVFGDGATVVNPIMSSGDINYLAFIGSARVASILEKQHPRPNRLTCIEGLNAKNPSIIFTDANLENAIKENLTGALSYNGQRCTAHKILFVQRGIADQFVGEFSKKVDAMKMGVPWEAGVQITALPEAGKTKYLDDLVADAVSKGAKVVNKNGGANQTYFSPVVLSDVKPNMRVYLEEQFGPVVPIVTFDDVNEVFDYMDSSEFGQQVAFFGKDAKVIGPSID